MNDLPKSLLALKFNLAALAFLGAGWFLVNIWLVLTGVLLAIAMFHELRMQPVSIWLRVGTFLATLAAMTGLYLHTANGDFLLAVVIYFILGVINPWPRHRADSSKKIISK
jgi:hypothetical protein